MVFQQYSLFPWKTVRDNIAFGPLRTGRRRAEALPIADHFLEMIGLTGFAKHYPAELSGGMQQRIFPILRVKSALISKKSCVIFALGCAPTITDK